MQHVNRAVAVALGLTVLLAQAACTPALVSSWKAPDATPFELRGEKIAAVVVSIDDATRLAGEDALARQLSLQGVEGVPMYTLVPGGDPSDEAAARAAAERAGVVGVVLMRPVRVDKELSTRSSYSGPMLPGLWGGYFGYGWGSPYSVDIRMNTILTIETMVYDLRGNKLVWAGQSRTTNPRDVNRVIEHTAKQVATELARLGLMRQR
jgi:hypothetical protein